MTICMRADARYVGPCRHLSVIQYIRQSPQYVYKFTQCLVIDLEPIQVLSRAKEIISYLLHVIYTLYAQNTIL